MNTFNKNIVTVVIICVIAVLTLSALQAKAVNYKVGVSQSKLQYEWYGASAATFEFDLTVVRLGAEYEFNDSHSIEARYGYGFDMGDNAQVDITGQEYTISFSNYHEFEVLYRYNISDSLNAYAGLGYYLQETPISWNESSYHYDEDNDDGFFVGAEYYVTDSLAVDLFIKQTSKIGDGKGKSTTKALGSTIRQVGFGVTYRF